MSNCYSCLIQIRKLAQIRHYLSIKSASIVEAAIISSKLYYPSSLYIRAIEAQLSRRQHVPKQIRLLVLLKKSIAMPIPVLSLEKYRDTNTGVIFRKVSRYR